MFVLNNRFAVLHSFYKQLSSGDGTEKLSKNLEMTWNFIY